MKTLITDEQKEEVKRLYRLQKHTIKQIMKLTGVRSEQTIYVILDEGTYSSQSNEENRKKK